MALMFVYLIFALALSFLCSVLEAVLLSTPLSYVTLKEAEGDHRALLFKKLKQNIDRPIAAILSINTIAHTIGAAGVGAEAVKVFGQAYFGLISAILTLLILVLSEIIPKTIGANYWRSLAMVSGQAIRVLVWVSYPLVWLSEFITRLITPKDRGVSVSREEISAMVGIGEEEGTFQSRESGFIQNIIKMETVRVRDIMTPRIVVTTASEDMTIEEFHADPSMKHSRIPVYSGNKENITGYVLRQTVLEKLAGDKYGMKLSEIKREIHVTVDSAYATKLWEDLLSAKEQIALIIDEYGSFEGIVTMEDIIETLLGFEILDEKDSIADMQQYAKEKWEERMNSLDKKR